MGVIRWRTGTVTALTTSWHGVVQLNVMLTGNTTEAEHGVEVRALAYPELVGTPEPGDRVVLNTTALAMGLGTGGYAMVVAIPDRLPADPTGPGHMVKARYTPLQATMMGIDEQDSPHHDAITTADSIDGMPVVIADLHSALPAVLAGIQSDAPDAKVAYLMTDGGALPIWFSRTVSELRSRLCGTVTVGQAFGGDAEAVTVHSGLLAARHVLGADVTIVTQGPGNLGTGTPWGFSGVAAGEAANAVEALGGKAIGALRISDADPRERHVGVSHHSTTAFGTVALAPVDLVVPSGLDEKLKVKVSEDLQRLARRQQVVNVETAGLDAALRACPVKLSTMGRGLDSDYAYFLAAAAAGRHATTLLADTPPL